MFCNRCIKKLIALFKKNPYGMAALCLNNSGSCTWYIMSNILLVTEVFTLAELVIKAKKSASFSNMISMVSLGTVLPSHKDFFLKRAHLEVRFFIVFFRADFKSAIGF